MAKGKRSLSQLVTCDPAHAAELRDLAQFIAYGARVAARALRHNAAEAKHLHGAVHPATPGGIHFLIGLAQEFATIGRAR